MSGVITFPEGYPCMRHLMNDNREYEYWENRQKLHGEKVPEVVTGG